MLTTRAIIFGIKEIVVNLFSSNECCIWNEWLHFSATKKKKTLDFLSSERKKKRENKINEKIITWTELFEYFRYLQK